METLTKEGLGQPDFEEVYDDSIVAGIVISQNKDFGKHGVTHIEYSSFEECGIRSITIPASVKNIDDRY